MRVSNRCFWALAVLSACAIMSSSSRGSDPDELRLKKLSIVDGQGRERIVLDIDKYDDSEIRFSRPNKTYDDIDIYDGPTKSAINIQRGLNSPGRLRMIQMADVDDSDYPDVTISKDLNHHVSLYNSMRKNQ